jgi:3-dehydroquinate synthase
MTKVFYSLNTIHKVVKESEPSKVCVVTSKKLYKKLSWVIEEMNITDLHIVLIPDGESSKEWKELDLLLEKFSRLNLDRHSLVIALGGGTVGDLVGFATSIYLRGIRYIQVPTTLLAQVDSSHGGKTGINFLGCKNQIGSFYTPLATIIDTRFVLSLSKDQIVDGLGEIIKAGLIKDTSILSLLRKHTIHNLAESKSLLTIIKKSIAVKDYFTNRDFNDAGLRQILNVGHTLGHSIELKYKISHGKAVIIGMLQELACLESLKIIPSTVRNKLENLLAEIGIKIDTSMKADWKTIAHDKKITGKTIDFPIIESEGNAKLIKLDLDILKNILT